MTLEDIESGDLSDLVGFRFLLDFQLEVGKEGVHRNFCFFAFLLSKLKGLNNHKKRRELL